MDGSAGRGSDELEHMREQLAAARRDVSYLLGALAQQGKSLVAATARLAEKDATIAQLEAVLDGDDVQREELPFNARADLGVRGCL
jgi:hypothetical protein